MKLEAIRNKIDILDEKILSNLAERINLVKVLKKLKNRSGLPIEDKVREEKLMSNLIHKGKNLDLPEALIRQLFKLIISESKKIQEEK